MQTAPPTDELTNLAIQACFLPRPTYPNLYISGDHLKKLAQLYNMVKNLHI